MLKNTREWRRALGWSQFRLEQESGVSRNKIALFEQGYRSLTKEEHEKVNQALSQRSESKKLKENKIKGERK